MAAPAPPVLPSTSATPIAPPEKKKRGRKPKNPAPEPAAAPAPVVPASPVKALASSQVGGPDNIKSPRGAGSSSWRGPPAGSASFQVGELSKNVNGLGSNYQNKREKEALIVQLPGPK